MPEGVGYGPQFTSSTGLTLNYIGEHCYAYSGNVSVNNVETTLLLFDTGSSLVVSQVQFRYASSGTAEITEDFSFRLYLNDEFIMSSRAKADTEWFAEQFVRLIISPYTTVKVTAQNVTDSDARGMAALVTGRIYK